MPKSLALIGMPGCGKSAVGRGLANALGYKFIDTDYQVSKKAGMSIVDIFEQKGEAFFRRLEAEAIAEAALLEMAVVSTGGGAVLRSDNMERLSGRCVVIYIKRSCESILSTSTQSERPLLSQDPRKIYELFDQRRELYEKYAQVAIENESTLQDAVDSILSCIRKP